PPLSKQDKDARRHLGGHLAFIRRNSWGTCHRRAEAAPEHEVDEALPKLLVGEECVLEHVTPLEGIDGPPRELVVTCSPGVPSL
ncbi:MAG TPA: hypothetical protein PLL33_11665, partial [Paracoccus sp. (in: a-proteobacteria)]|nr:hypothetical protein [Paracoccus sp. (in: a-proteobacteria)]